MTQAAKEEIMMLTDMAYLPVAQKNGRYNGMDFLEVAFQLKSVLLKQTPDIDMEEVALVMIEAFNSHLNPKIGRQDMEGMARMIAKYDSFSSMLKSVRGY